MYCLAVAAQETGIVIHAVCVLSNHYHILLSDPDTRVSEFYGWVHKYVAKCVNASYGRFENLWSSEKVSVIKPESSNDILDKTVYTLSNPVKARLVASGEKWPGVWLYKRSHSQTVTRPNVYFSDDGDMPKQVQLNIEPPAQFEYLGAAEYEQHIADKLEEESLKIRTEMSALGQSFLGVRGIMAQNPYGYPGTREKRFNINPKVAAKNKWLRMEAIARNKAFLLQYKQALKRWRDGDRDVRFPYGTYALRIHSAVKVEPG